jgi:hypothetical protein
MLAGHGTQVWQMSLKNAHRVRVVEIPAAEITTVLQLSLSRDNASVTG